MEVISVIHSIMAVAMSLWTYSRYSRRCATSYGDDFVFGHVNDVGYVTSEGVVPSLCRMNIQSLASVTLVPLFHRGGT